MTNFERYRSVFEEWSEKDQIAILNNKPKRCYDVDVKCDICDLRKPGTSCSTALVKWLYKEYKETPVLTKAQYYFLKSINPYARIKKITDGIEIQTTENFRVISNSTLNDFFSGFPELKKGIWYDVSDMLEWEVEEDDWGC